ncbi:hypothetical protein [Photobacterium sp. TY1-4]|uniref:hypothetical protein n=1 Tax=Photobacterium sp. TY1-4 TaxID=2899122 RepID=UPI0021BF97A3|nr:hypothetical protein [Photobacterium sp. TY1-4]UXI03896.1 hypothetical protein NH461_17385 [Photobacterium sp. TY1-4]
MFEPLIADRDELKLGISAPEAGSVDQEYFIPLSQLSKALILDSSFDLLLVSGASPQQAQIVTASCEKSATVVAFVESPSADMTAIWDVMVNLSGKLFSNEMPDNIDVADVRNLVQDSDVLFAFNCKNTAIDYLADQDSGEVVGGIYLAHRHTDLAEYESTNQQLLRYISAYGYLSSSVYRRGRADSTILLGIRALL